MVISLLLISCEEEGKPSYTPKPAIEMTVLSVAPTEAEVQIRSINADKVMYQCLHKKDSRDLQAVDILRSGVEVTSKRFKIEGLEENSEYHIFAAAADVDGQFSAVQRDTIITPNDPSNDKPEVPSEPENPRPGDPETPSEPDDPELPSDPNPEQPEDPVDPEIPEEPSDPETPGDPEDPEIPENPQEPEIPENPVEPEQPEEPEIPVDPIEPEPEEPSEPEVPGEPEIPADPDVPEIPEEPSEPDLPEEPEPEPEPEDPIDRLPDANGHYWWEQGRTTLPKFADMALCYGGHSARSPQTWTKERFEKTVIYTDENGQKHWFFDAMLMLEIWDDNYSVTYSLSANGENSSKKTHWERLLDYWFADNTGFKALDDCIAENAARIGDPPTPRYIVFSLPDPVYFENYYKGATGSNKNTVYWGTIDGVTMDFSKMDHMLKAYKWYINEIRARFAEKGYKHIELLGFYIISETLTMKGGWRYEYKKHEELIPKVADFCHTLNEGLYWIPYSVGDTEHNKAVKNWKKFGFDLAILQPNYYWENKSWATTCDYINKYDMGIEFEFEGTHGGSTSILGNSSTAVNNKSRFREYMTKAKNYGIYGKKPIVLYTGTNALYELAASSNTSDRELYHELGEFIIQSTLKKK